MASSPNWPPIPAELGAATVVARLAPNAWRLRRTDSLPGSRPGGDVVLKTGPGVADEAAGLRALAEAIGPTGGPPVPPVILAAGDVLVTGWVEPGGRTPVAEEELGRALAALHRAPAAGWGGGSSWIGDCRVDPSPAPDAAGFYGRRLRELAGRCGMDPVVAQLAERLPELIPPGPPALLHGDLWWGNVLWGTGDRPWLIDPSVHGGHPEEDLAMLALFGPVPDRLIRAYSEVRVLESGWAERLDLWQLYPLLVHTVLFGGGYRASAEAAARRYL